jgi:hypothetical protein
MSGRDGCGDGESRNYWSNQKWQFWFLKENFPVFA